MQEILKAESRHSRRKIFYRKTQLYTSSAAFSLKKPLIITFIKTICLGWHILFNSVRKPLF